MLTPADDDGQPRTLADSFADPQECADLIERVSGEGQIRSERVRWTAPDGSPAWVSLSATLRTASGGAPVVDGLVQDVTEEQQLREALRRATHDLRAIIENSGAVVVVLAADGTIEMVNSAFERFSGYSRAEVERISNWNRFMSIADGEHAAERRRVLLAAPESGPRSGRFDFVTRDGRTRRVHATEAALPGVNRSVVSLVNISERQRAEDRLMHNVFHDGLTGLPNRLSVMDRLESVAKNDRREPDAGIGLLVVDVDEFKGVNDRFGYRIGDLLLRSMPRRIEGAVPGAEMVARTGPDSFAVMLEPAHRSSVEAAAKAVVSALTDPFQYGECTIQCTVSLGAALATGGAGVDTLFRDAESAMYAARRAGGDRWKWHED
jgi:diguanylate cyclase (GGDEF)-like protein/PAS domain S-box-containing protein